MAFLLTLSPQVSTATLSVAAAGDVLTINGTDYDFSPLPEGATLPRSAVACDVLTSDVERVEGQIRLTLRFPYPSLPFPAPPGSEVVTHPEPILVTEDGPVTLPSYKSEDVA